MSSEDSYKHSKKEEFEGSPACIRRTTLADEFMESLGLPSLFFFFPEEPTEPSTTERDKFSRFRDKLWTQLQEYKKIVKIFHLHIGYFQITMPEAKNRLSTARSAQSITQQTHV